MTKEELLKKNKAIKLARELRKAQLEEKEPEPVKVMEEEKPQEPEVLEEESKREEMVEQEENQIVIEEEKEEQPKKKKGGRKPANREYMVVEETGIEEEAEPIGNSEEE